MARPGGRGRGGSSPPRSRMELMRLSARRRRRRLWRAGAALLGAMALLSGLFVSVPSQSGATIVVTDSFAYSTSDSPIVGNSNNSAVAAGQLFPCLNAATIVSSGFADQIAATGNIGTVTFVASTTDPNFTVSSAGAVSVPTGTLALGTYTWAGTDSAQASPPATGHWSYTLNVVASDPNVEQTAPTANTTTTTDSASFTGVSGDQLAVTNNTGSVNFA